LTRTIRTAVLFIAVAAILMGLRAWMSGQFASRERDLEELKSGVYALAPQDYPSRIADIHAMPSIVIPEVEGAAASSFEANPGFVGPRQCQSCHQELFDTWLTSTHSQTAGEATRSLLEELCLKGGRALRSAHSDLKLEVELTGDGAPSQKVSLQRDGDVYSQRFSIDLVMGSGKIGRTFLHWQGGRLYELPMTWYSELTGWVNSPGYRDGVADFARPIVPECVQCHATWISHQQGTLNSYHRDEMILGISCERCHGPGRSHLQAMTAGNDASAPEMTRIADLPRDRQVEVCSQCHAGSPHLLKSPFEYRPGEELSKYLRIDDADSAQEGGVHSANQQKRLAKSQCYQKSSAMTCTNCHDPHRPRLASAADYAARCVTCHKRDDCGEVRLGGNDAEHRCIECHMPVSEDKKMSMQLGDRLFHPPMRDHWIRVTK
jgi:hypothetical protein